MNARWTRVPAGVIPVHGAESMRGVHGLRVTREILAAIIDHMARCLPNEGVGLLSASDVGGSLYARRYYPGRNVDASRSPARFTMHPDDVVSSFDDMESRGTRLGAIVHSHPTSPPVPSAFDLAEASIPGALSVIVGFQPALVVRAWRLLLNDEGAVVSAKETPVIIERGGRGPEDFVEPTIGVTKSWRF